MRLLTYDLSSHNQEKNSTTYRPFLCNISFFISSKGYLTEIGPEVAPLQEFGLVDSGLDYVGRTELNAKHSDVTIWFGHSDTAGWIATHRLSEIEIIYLELTLSPSFIAFYSSRIDIICLELTFTPLVLLLQENE